MNDYLIYFNQKYNGDWEKIYNALKTFEIVNKKELDKVRFEKYEYNEGKFTILDDDIYPKQFNILNKPPFVLDWKGNIELLKSKKIYCLTGNYEIDYVIKYLDSIDDIKEDVTIVSAYWKGLDEKIVDKCLNNNLKLILISPNGIENPYFAKNISNFKTENILILSEYPKNYHVTKKTLFARNRIIAALANNLVLFGLKDYSLNNLIDQFLLLGKDIYCFGPEKGDSNNRNIELINSGAELITSLSIPISKTLEIEKH
ncbi:DNA-processing protein DprA [Metamycoplasma buccale]|uniref:DNA-processing protein DprA n=1 Tax=Metamycoplasma buccale TaxID=55602 RepID=UPI00398EEB96